MADARPPLPPVTLIDLPSGGGTTAGTWNVWRDERSNSYHFFVCVLTGAVIYWPWTSNGWINYLSGGGNWYVIWLDGSSEPQERHELEVNRFINRPPRYALANGNWTLGEWTIESTPETLTLRYNLDTVSITLNRRNERWSHNGQVVTLP